MSLDSRERRYEKGVRAAEDQPSDHAMLLHFQVGNRVFFQGLIGDINRSTFQQYVTIPASLVAHTPSNVTDDEAGGISLAATAGWTSLFAKQGLGIAPAPWEKGGDQAGHGKAVVVLGGGSSVGQYTIQLARLAGFHVVTSASKKHSDWLKKLGAAVVLDRTSATTKEYVEALSGKPLAGVSDAVSLEDSQALAVEIVKQYNAATNGTETLVITTNLQPNEASVQAAAESKPPIEFRSILGIGHGPELRPQAEQFVVAVSDWLKGGVFFPNKPEVTPGGLRGVPAALKKNEEGVSGIKVIVRPNETEA